LEWEWEVESGKWSEEAEIMKVVVVVFS